MAKLKIFKFPDVVLTKIACPIARVEKKLYSLADDMLETMYDAPGIGLAANQVGILDRILVIDTEYDAEREEGEDQDQDDDEAGEVFPEASPSGNSLASKRIITNKKPKIIINPKIIYKEGEILFSEGCLSVPEYTAEVKRAEKIKLEYQDIDGLAKTLRAEGLQAVCIQHEMDHLDGKLFIDRLSPLKKQFARKKLLRERKERESDGDS